MKLVMTLLVRDEADIIESMLKYHFAHGVDHIVVTDNGSVDGTYQLCRQFEAQGLVTLLRQPPSDFSQHRWVSAMANLAYEKHRADWVIHADADELFVPSAPFQHLKEALAGASRNQSVLAVARHDFVATDRPMSDPPQITMIYRKAVSLNIRGRRLAPKVVHRGASNVVVSQGNHSVTGDGLGCAHRTGIMSVFHYPIRSYEQFHNKVKNGGGGYAQNTELDRGLGFHKRHWYRLLLEGKLRAEFAQHWYPAERLATALQDGSLIEDTQIAESFRPIR